MSEWQDVIREAVYARGYTKGSLTYGQFVLKQLAKMVEEVAEYAECVKVASQRDRVRPMTRLDEMCAHLNSAAEEASHIFIAPGALPIVVDQERGAKELGDVLVTVAMSASALGIDIERIAIDKATQDVTRGVR